MEFYDRVKELLKQNNLTLQATLEKVGINLDAYKSCKRYGNLPRADEVYRLAIELNTTVEFLITGQESNPYKDKFDSLVTAIKGLPIS